MGHVLGAHHDSLISPVVEYFHPLERTNAWLAATHTISQSLFPSLWVTQALYLPVTRIITTYFLSDTQWPHHIPLAHILSQSTLIHYINALTQRITNPLTQLDHKIVHRLAHATGLSCRSHIMYHPGYIINTLEALWHHAAWGPRAHHRHRHHTPH
jgi:hypothetical protein